jgi:2-hydroxymuconate-semialdehyde hydrolase
MAENNPAIANSIKTGSFNTNYHDVGEGFPIVFLHGSGPGVSAYANWNKVMPILKDTHRLIAPDMVGFGYTDRPEGVVYGMDAWVQQTIDLFDALEIEQADLVGNSFGGALALAMAVKYPNRIRKLILMGAMGVNFPITYGLDRVWGYTPSFENMKELLDIFAYDRSIVNDDLARLRYESSKAPGFQESFGAMFPEPRQKGVAAMANNEVYLRSVKHETLIVHGREDRVIPPGNSLKLIDILENAQLHIFGKCGHWTQIEKAESFAKIVEVFLNE